MILNEIRIHNVRNIRNAKIALGNHLNILYGENGSGKTSVLEAIYLLSSGKSFRSSQITKIIKENENKLTLFGKLLNTDKTTLLGFEKSKTGHVIHIDGEVEKQLAALAKCLPVLVVTQDSHKLLEAGPQWRRQFIDWGLFHVKHEFYGIWSNYRKLLKNRNQALLNKADVKEINAWDDGLATSGELYTRLRAEYVAQLLPYFREFAGFLLEGDDFDLKYKRGWQEDISFHECLIAQYERDRFKGRTAYGPHRGDVAVLLDGKDSRDHVSRGQQKLLVYALNLAQIASLKQVSKKDTLLLLDDLGAELDLEHSSQLLRLISEHFSQVCITTANLDSLPLENIEDIKMFHVKHGNVEPVN